MRNTPWPAAPEGPAQAPSEHLEAHALAGLHGDLVIVGLLGVDLADHDARHRHRLRRRLVLVRELLDVVERAGDEDVIGDPAPVESIDRRGGAGLARGWGRGG